eukprot:gene35095-27188_t
MDAGGARRGWVVLGAGFCVHLCLGTANSWGNLSTYVTSCIRAHRPGASYADTFWTFAVLNAAAAIVVPFSGVAQRAFGTRAVC